LNAIATTSSGDILTSKPNQPEALPAMAGFFFVSKSIKPGVNLGTSSSKPLRRIRLKRKTSKAKNPLAKCQTNEQLKPRNEKPV